MTGLRPIVEGMNMGFLLLAFNQISKNCGMLHYTSGGQYKVPMVIRGPGGVGKQLGAEHSQRLESYFQSIPGVQLVAVSTVANAKALLKSVRHHPAAASPLPFLMFTKAYQGQIPARSTHPVWAGPHTPARSRTVAPHGLCVVPHACITQCTHHASLLLRDSTSACIDTCTCML